MALMVISTRMYDTRHRPALAHGWPFVWRRNDRCTIDAADWVWDGDANEFLTMLGLQPMADRQG